MGLALFYKGFKNLREIIDNRTSPDMLTIKIIQKCDGEESSKK